MRRLLLALLMAFAVVLAPSAMAASCGAQPAPAERNGHCAGEEPARDDAVSVEGVHCALCSAIAPRITGSAPAAARPLAAVRPPALAALGSLAAATDPPPPRIFARA